MDKEFTLCLLRLGDLTWASGTFIVEIEDIEGQIELRIDEHVEWAWVSEAEIDKKEFQSGNELKFVSEAMRMTILEAFRLKRKGMI